MTSSDRQNILEIKGLRKEFGANVALKDISFNVKEREFIVVLGRSGAGKSTLMRCINRLIDPTAGEIVFQDKVLSGKKEELRLHRRGIGMIFQQFNLVKRLSVIKNVLVGSLGYKSLLPSLCHIFSKEEKLRALACLDRVDIVHKAYQRADTLSGGEQQRVAIARALNQNPVLLLADEPVASLDPTIARTVLNYLRQINQQLGITVLLNIHQVNYAREIGRRVIGLAKGVVEYDGDIDDLNDEVLRGIYGGAPEETYDEI